MATLQATLSSQVAFYQATLSSLLATPTRLPSLVRWLPTRLPSLNDQLPTSQTAIYRLVSLVSLPPTSLLTLTCQPSTHQETFHSQLVMKFTCPSQLASDVLTQLQGYLIKSASSQAAQSSQLAPRLPDIVS